MDKVKDEPQKIREVLMNSEHISMNLEIKCDCCGHIFKKQEPNSSCFGRYITCPECSYIQYMSYFKKVPPFWKYKIVDEKGNDILDFNGNCRLFDGVDVAKEYIAFCDMSEKCIIEKADYYGDVF